MKTKPFSHFIARPLSLLAAMLTLIPIGLTTATAHDDRGPQRLHARHFHILPPRPHPLRNIYAQYQAKWWQWATSLPADHHPLLDTADCSAGQSGPVWFLGGVFGAGAADRTCSIPAGKALFFPVLNQAYFGDLGETEAEMRAVVNIIMEHIVRMSVEIDGIPISHLNRFRTESALFNVGPFPANAVFGLAEGATYPAVDDGVYLLLLPLSPGAHTIHCSGEVFVPKDVLGFEYGFTQDFTYHITVERRR